MNLLGPELVRDLVSLIQRTEADDAVDHEATEFLSPDSHGYFTPLAACSIRAATALGLET